MKVTLLASGAFALPTFQRLIAGGYEIAVGTQPARPAGRGRRLAPTAVGRYAADAGLSVEELDDVNSPEGLAWLDGTHCDLIVVVAFGQKLGPAVRAAAQWGCINVHPSLLPRWRGAAPVPAALLAGDDPTGVCVIDVVERMDAGALLGSRTTPVGRKDAGELLEELAETGAGLLLDVIDGLARGDVERVAQDESAVTRSKKLHSDDGRIRWEHDSVDVDRRVRAVTPRPGAFCLMPDGSRLRILAGEPAACERGHLPGEVLAPEDQLPSRSTDAGGAPDAEAGGVVVACGQGAYRITRLQREGKRPLEAEEFLRGQALPAGVRLGP